MRCIPCLVCCLFVKEFIKRFPKTDHPAAFGQHVNADITSLIEETNALLGTMVSRDDEIILSTSVLFLCPKRVFHDPMQFQEVYPSTHRFGETAIRTTVGPSRSGTSHLHTMRNEIHGIKIVC